jgi:hypothetical protein
MEQLPVVLKRQGIHRGSESFHLGSWKGWSITLSRQILDIHIR